MLFALAGRPLVGTQLGQPMDPHGTSSTSAACLLGRVAGALWVAEQYPPDAWQLALTLTGHEDADGHGHCAQSGSAAPSMLLSPLGCLARGRTGLRLLSNCCQMCQWLSYGRVPLQTQA